MERRKLTKEDIDKVRNIEGFPIAKDEDIIALSDAPYYTACPNPFIEEFIKENGTPYDEATDDYHREPFAADVSEGKSDTVYNVHSYHTKVPHKAIMRYILHYTKPGDIIYDGFCGSGMTGVAAQLCEDKKTLLELGVKNSELDQQVGSRVAILSDLSPAATFTAANYRLSTNSIDLKQAWEEIKNGCQNECGWMFDTNHTSSLSNGSSLFEPIDVQGRINYTIWSEVLICPQCGKEFTFWDVAVDEEDGGVREKISCPNCNAELTKSKCEKSLHTYEDDETKEIVSVPKQVPVLINYTANGKKYNKKPDSFDIQIIEKVEHIKIPYWYPTDMMMHIGEKWGDSYRTGIHTGITRVHQFFTKRNLYVLAYIINKAKKYPQDVMSSIMAAMKSAFSYGTKMIKVNVGRILNGGGLFAMGFVSGTLYIPSIMAERNILDAVENKIESIIKLNNMYKRSAPVYINTGSSADVKTIPDSSIDYIFTDPPFGDNLNYSELNFIWESWEKIFTNNKQEAIINKSQHKGLQEYQSLMNSCFAENYRILKPGRWMTVEFHNSKNNVWNAIQQSLLGAGFIIADVRTLDKKQGSFKQVNYSTSVQQDLVISAYKPKDSFKSEMLTKAGTQETAWSFVQQHLEKLPVVVVKNGNIEMLSERQPYLLFDRMIAYHIMNGLPVPIDAADFYLGLDEHYLKRDGMYFLSNQVNEYDTARIVNEVEPIQFAFLVSNEKTAISWLYQQLDTPQTYAEIQPKFMQEIKTVDKFEAMPELSVLLEENFLQDDKGKWYVPDVTKEADVAKLREKNLLKEFEGYLATKGKLKLFRAEAIRVGFAKLWKDKNYQLIVDTAERLPEQIIQEDDKLLMYYDISLGRVQ